MLHASRQSHFVSADDFGLQAADNRRVLRVLYSEGETGGGGPEEQDVPPLDAPPPAAKIVVEGAKTERELALEQELEAEKSGRKKDQTRLSELEDENHRLKEPTRDPKPKPKKYKGAAFGVLGWED